MTTLEFRDQFELLYNNITSNQAPGLDDYEKSVFLTRALDDIINAYIHPRNNRLSEGFDGNDLRPIEFSSLTTEKSYSPITTLNSFIEHKDGVCNIKIDDDIHTVINEFAKVVRGTGTEPNTVLLGKRISYLEYDRLMSKPYKRPLKRLCWRLTMNKTNNSTTANSYIIAGPKDTIKEYTIRYIKKPKPIILSNIAPQTIDGLNTTTECELDKVLHKVILQRAVELAKAAYTSDPQLLLMIMLGQASQTNKGFPMGGGQ